MSYKMTAKILTKTRCIISVAQFLSFTSTMHTNGTHKQTRELHNLALQCSCWTESSTQGL